MAIIRKRAKNTLGGVEMDHGDVLEYRRGDGEVVKIEVLGTSAEVMRTTLKQLRAPESAGRTDYRFGCELKVNGQGVRIGREVSTQGSFYEPLEVGGVRIWLDAVGVIFEKILQETHGECRPRREVRLAIQDVELPICPEPLHPWCPLPEGGLRIEQCYRGEDCWLGAYDGADAHGGLDINHPRGTPLWAPVDIHDHFYFNSLEMGHNNNRWRGIHHWENGAQWILQAHHMTALTVPEHRPIRKGEQFAYGAGVLSGDVDHSHFVFKIHDEGETVLLDPWILFWQMYRDQQKAGKSRNWA